MKNYFFTLEVNLDVKDENEIYDVADKMEKILEVFYPYGEVGFVRVGEIECQEDEDEPNATTRKAIAELEIGQGKRFANVAALMADLEE